MDSNLNLPFSEFCDLGNLSPLSCLDLHLSLVQEARRMRVTGATVGLLVSGTWGGASVFCSLEHSGPLQHPLLFWLKSNFAKMLLPFLSGILPVVLWEGGLAAVTSLRETEVNAVLFCFFFFSLHSVAAGKTSDPQGRGPSVTRREGRVRLAGGLKGYWRQSHSIEMGSLICQACSRTSEILTLSPHHPRC